MGSRRLRKSGKAEDEEEEKDAFASGSESSTLSHDGAAGEAQKGDQGAPADQEEEKVTDSAEPSRGAGRWRKTGGAGDGEQEEEDEEEGEDPSIPSEGEGDEEEEEGEAPPAKQQAPPQEEEEAAVKVPRDTRYFLHDDRGREEEAGEAGADGEAEDPEAETKRGKGRQRPVDHEGPWLHDKYYELVERKAGASGREAASQRSSARYSYPSQQQQWGGRDRDRDRDRDVRDSDYNRDSEWFEHGSSQWDRSEATWEGGGGGGGGWDRDGRDRWSGWDQRDSYGWDSGHQESRWDGGGNDSWQGGWDGSWGQRPRDRGGKGKGRPPGGGWEGRENFEDDHRDGFVSAPVKRYSQMTF